jgi:hypothetical protein
MLFSCVLQLSEPIQTPRIGGLGVWELMVCNFASRKCQQILVGDSGKKLGTKPESSAGSAGAWRNEAGQREF